MTMLVKHGWLNCEYWHDQTPKEQVLMMVVVEGRSLILGAARMGWVSAWGSTRITINLVKNSPSCYLQLVSMLVFRIVLN